MSGSPSSRSYVSGGRDESGVLERLRRSEVEVGEGEREERRDPDEDAGAGQPPPFAEPAGEAHHDDQRDAERDEARGEHDPVLDEPVEVAEVGLVVAPVPPVRDRAKRNPHEPRDRDPEHPEEHPRADRPRRRLAHERDSSPRIDREHGEERDLRERPQQVVEALEALRAGDECCAEDLVDVDRRKGEVVRHVRRVEEERSNCEDRGDGDREGDSQRAPPRASGAVPLNSVSAGLPRSTGAAYG